MQGQRLGNYEILDKLGEGGMGEVWRARDERLNRTVAVKLLPADLASDPQRRARFELEAKALGALNHPNIVAIYDVGQDNGRLYIVSEFVDGESLRAVIDQGPLPARKLIDYAVQMAEALAAAHVLGIVHRDLKPENVMVTRAGRVKVLDFGLAKQNRAPSDGQSTTIDMDLSQPGAVMGTAGYMSPEQVRGEPADARSDIFSFGCVLYEMISGRRAFHGPSSVETMHAILHQDPPEFESYAALPQSLGPIVRRCLEKLPAQRFQSASDLAFALRAITPTTVSGTPIPAAAARRPRRTWIWIAVIAAAAELVAAVLMRPWTRPRPTPQFQRLTFRKGFINNARFTPDGRNVIYEASWEGGPSHIYLSVPGSPESHDLGTPAGSHLLAVSSKEELAYSDGSGALMRGSIAGGQMRPLLDDVDAADWSPDGSSLAVMRDLNGTVRIEYPIGHVLAEAPFAIETIRVSPDGNRVAYATRFHGRALELNVVDRSGKQQSLGAISGQTSSNEPYPLVWSPKGDEIWFRSYDANDTQTIYAVDMKGHRRVVANLPANVSLLDISHDGRALLSAGSSRWGILGVAPGETQERDLSCLDGGIVMGISNDGRMIVATVTGAGAGPKGSVYVRNTDASPPVRLGDGTAYTISPDGKWVSGYIVADDGLRRFVLFPTGAGEKVSVDVPQIKPAAVFGWLAGDQRYLVAGRLPDKKFQCFAWDRKRGTAQPVCPEGTPDRIDISASPDGTKALNAGLDGGWFVYSVDGSPAQEVKGINDDEMPAGWRADNRSLYVMPHRAGDVSTSVWIVDIATGKRTLWKEIHPSQPIDARYDLHLHVTPDGRAYAYNFSLQLSDLYLAQGLH